MTIHYALAVLAYLVPTFLTGFVWHLVAFHDIYTRLNIYRPDPIILFDLGSMLVQGGCSPASRMASAPLSQAFTSERSACLAIHCLPGRASTAHLRQVSTTSAGWSFAMSFRLLATERWTWRTGSSFSPSSSASTGRGYS